MYYCRRFGLHTFIILKFELTSLYDTDGNNMLMNQSSPSAPPFSIETTLKQFFVKVCATFITHVGLTLVLRLTQNASGSLNYEICDVLWP